MPGTLLAVPVPMPGVGVAPGLPVTVLTPCPGVTFMPCVLPVFCDALVDWFVVAPELIRALLLSPRKSALLDTPVAAFGFTYCSGFVCELWLVSVRCRGAAARRPLSRVRCSGATFMPCVLDVFCEAEVDWLVVAFEFMRI